MATPLTPFSITAPGYFGVNTQDSPVDMDDKFALDAQNCVIDKFGRIGSRKGFARANTANADLGSSDITCLGELVQNDGTVTTLAAGGAFLFKKTGSTLTTLTYGGPGVAPVITASNWQFVALNGIAIFFQRANTPLIYDPAVSTTTFRRLSEKVGYTGTVPLANCALSAYGRIWCADTTADKNTVSFSDVITPQIWTGGSSGTLNLLGVWPRGGDEVVGLAAHNGFLFIFGRKQTLIYSGALIPATMVLSDSLTGVGCIARDSIQNTGGDIVFLSDSGVRSVGRTVQEKSAPMGAWSRNVHNDIQAYITVENGDNIKSVYNIDQAFYLLTFPTAQITYCFDTLTTLPDGSARVTTWPGVPSKSFVYIKARDLYMGKPGYIGLYSTYLDDASTYTMYFYTAWKDFGNQTQQSVLKKISTTLVGVVSQSVIFRWGFDYLPSQYSETVNITSLAAVSQSVCQGAGFGATVQIGFESVINGNQVSFQRIDVLARETSIQAPSYAGGAITYATWNGLDKSADVSLSSGALTAASVVTDYRGARSTVGKSSSKWYWEYNTSVAGPLSMGIGTSSASLTSTCGFDVHGWGYLDNGQILNNNVLITTVAAWTSGDVIGIALDMSVPNVKFYKNNVLQTTQAIAAGTWFAMFSGGGASMTANFGASPLTYTAPAGFNSGIYS